MRPLSLCHSSESLYQDFHPVYEEKDPINGLDLARFQTLKKQVRDLMGLNPLIKVIIDRDRYLYDTKNMPHLAYGVEDVREGDTLNVLIVDVKELMKYGELIGSLQNSKI